VTLPPSKLAAARIAAAEIFIAEGLQGTNWAEPDAEPLRLLAEEDDFTFTVKYPVAVGSICVGVEEHRGEVRVFIAAEDIGRMSRVQAIDAAMMLLRAEDIARKVEAAIAKVAGEGET
jgi:hypothetical protein